MKRQQKMTISDPLSTRGSKQQIKAISSIWKGKHTRFETSHLSLPKSYWKKLYSSWKKDPELDMDHIVPCDHQDFQTYKELADFSIQHHNNQNERSYEFVGVQNVHMDASVSGYLYIFLSIFAEIPKILDLNILGSKLEVCLQTGEKKVVFCTHCLDLPAGSMPKPTHKRFPPSKKTPTPTPTPTQTLRRQLFQKYASAVTSRENPGHSLEVPKAHPNYSAIKELAELAIADYNKRHGEANFEFVGLTHWSAGGTSPRSIYLFIEFVAKDCKSDLKGPAGILTFDCEVDIPFSTGTVKIVFCAQSESNLRN